MKSKLEFRIDGLKDVISELSESLKDRNKILSRMGKYLRFKASGKFKSQGPGWPPLVAKSIERNKAAAHQSLGNKLKKDLKRAEATAKKQKTVEARLSVLAEFRRLEAGGSKDISLLSPKGASKLHERIGRADDKGKKMLGGLSGSIKMKLAGNTITVYSEVPWSGIHNSGGSAGNGAQIPKREFLTIDDEDMEALKKLLLEQVDPSLK